MTDDMTRIAQADQLFASMATFARLTSRYMLALIEHGFDRPRAFRLMVAAQGALLTRKPDAASAEPAVSMPESELIASFTQIAGAVWQQYHGMTMFGLTPDEAFNAALALQMTILRGSLD